MRRAAFFGGLLILALYCSGMMSQQAATAASKQPATGGASLPAAPPVSDATSECLNCHETLHPGIVAGWRASRHAATTVAQAQAVEGLGRKVSSQEVPDALRTVAVGCAECHTMRAEAHADTFDHLGHAVHVVVSPADCAVCHSTEHAEFQQNLMAHAYANLVDNPLYNKMEQAWNGVQVLEQGRLVSVPQDQLTREEACLSCHGTKLEVVGTEARETDFGDLEFPVIAGWPNQGVGRVNLDGSLGSCAACHTRHHFSMKEARKADACKQCHHGPDVPAWQVYAASKHGAVYYTQGASWDFESTPWKAGEHFLAPTCATCHVSLVTTPDGDVINQRTHRMNDRLPWRIFGLPYAHAHPISPQTFKIRNKDGLALPTALDGTPATEFLISAEEQSTRREVMLKTCTACHDRSWAAGDWARLETTIRTTNESTRTATAIMEQAWNASLANPDNPFDEHLERLWSGVWLFSGNAVRFASAMAGGGDYGVFADGRYHITARILDLKDRVDQGLAAAEKKK